MKPHCKHSGIDNYIVLWKNIHIVKGKVNVNSTVSILGSVIVNSTVCICWEYAVDIVVESIVQ